MKKEDYTSIQVTKKFQRRLAILCLKENKKTYEALILGAIRDARRYRVIKSLDRATVHIPVKP